MVREALLEHNLPGEQICSSQNSSLIRCLYISHFLARWDARMWEFCVGLYMITLWPDSLILAAIYGAIESSSIAVFGPFVGQLVETFSYVQVLRIWLLTQNLSFITAGCTVFILITFSSSMNSTVFILLVILINISGAVGVLSTLAGTILIEREWVVVISEGHPDSVLTKMNSVIRRIDLTSKLVAPVVSGLVISFVSVKASAMGLAIWNSMAVWIEYWLLTSVYKGIPALAESGQRKASRCESQSLISAWKTKASFISAWNVYIQQEVVLPGIALALLYFTVLSFGSLMTATLEWEGIPAFIIGMARGLSALVGIAATVVYPLLQSHILTLRAGLWSVWYQWTCLILCIGSIWIRNKVLSAYMLMAGVATSRLGLWMFDLSVIQLMQDSVPECDRCVVGGVQNALQATMELMAYVMGIIISKPQDFWKLTTVSYWAVTMAALIYSIHIHRVRKHLFHFEKLPLLKFMITSPANAMSPSPSTSFST